MMASAGSIPFCLESRFLLGLRPQLIDMVEHHLVQAADARVEVARKRDVENQ